MMLPLDNNTRMGFDIREMSRGSFAEFTRLVRSKKRTEKTRRGRCNESNGCVIHNFLISLCTDYRGPKAAAAAFAQDIGSGLVKPNISRPGPSASSATAEQPTPKPSNPYANYSTPASLGYTDPDAERLAAEIAVRQTQGTAGDWQMVTPSFLQSGVSSKVATAHTPATTTVDGEAVAVGTKRAAEEPPEEDARSFKIRKKTLHSGLGEIYDPGVVSIKVKKKEPQEDAPLDSSSKSDPHPNGTIPKWTNIQLVKVLDKTPSTGEVVSDKKVESPTPASRESTPASSKWTKAKWSEPVVDPPPSDRASMFGSAEEKPPPLDGDQRSTVKTEVKVEEEAPGAQPDVTLSGDDVGGGSLFKKRRRAPGNSSIPRKPF